MATQETRRQSRTGQIVFVILMLGLMALFITLGMWQLERLGEKEALINSVETRLDQPPIAFPDVAQWQDVDPETINYRPIRLTGHFERQSVLVFTNLPDPNGPYGGVGYWVISPFVLEDGGIVWVNRGFVPEDRADEFADSGNSDQDIVTIEGVARRPERANAFTPAPDFDAGREWVRDPQRLAAFITAEEPIAPVTIDMNARGAGALPQGGETQVNFPNRHLEYAGTWFMFAAITPIMLGFWLWRQRRPGNLAQPDKAN